MKMTRRWLVFRDGDLVANYETRQDAADGCANLSELTGFRHFCVEQIIPALELTPLRVQLDEQIHRLQMLVSSHGDGGTK